MHTTSLFILGGFLIVIGVSVTIIGGIASGKAKSAQQNNSSSGHSKVKGDKCKKIAVSPDKVGLAGLFCNANTPSTWQNDQKFAKNFYPKDMDNQKALYKDNKSPAPFYAAINLYGERERQVESAQLLGKYQGNASSAIFYGIILTIVGLLSLLIGFSAKCIHKNKY